MNTIIEIHDSRISQISESDSAVIVHFHPAYLHKSAGRRGRDSGTGWIQEVLLIFPGASVSGAFPEFPCDTMDGELVVNGERHPNFIPVPLDVTGLIKLHLICDSVHTVTIVGRGARLELLGEPRHVEEFQP